MDTLPVAAFLPHRYPFLLVDRVVEITAGQRIIALKNVTINEPFFPGHFPDYPVMPGVLVCEAVVQAGGILVCSASSHNNDTSQPKYALLTALDKVRFRRQVIPGDQLRLEAETVRRRGKFWKMRGSAFVADTLAAELEFSLATVDPEAGQTGSTHTDGGAS
jgi:3-hydroxyacyl-[acyl-carrier-protein] dehydratase